MWRWPCGYPSQLPLVTPRLMSALPSHPLPGDTRTLHNLPLGPMQARLPGHSPPFQDLSEPHLLPSPWKVWKFMDLPQDEKGGGRISEMVPKALYGSWYRASRLRFLQQWTCVASFSLNAHPGSWPQGHPAAGPGPGQETGCPYLFPQHMGMVRNNVRLPWPFIFIYALIQQTFHNNMCQGVWINNM